ncbi:MAG: hypothetical protein A4E42_00823 [Methanoregulaceae archaeon PtaU1.Bin222]|nr:MAG: hypothetical protein A4E42_00823 [Methanoregulaceae archaeon PtaU1.Bin222]
MIPSKFDSFSQDWSDTYALYAGSCPSSFAGRVTIPMTGYCSSA